MKKIDGTMLQALRQAVEGAGSQSEFARRAGIGKQHISKYLKGDIKNIEHDTWLKLLPLIREFMPADCLSTSEPHPKWNIDDEVWDAPPMKAIPVISVAQAAGFDCTLEAFDDYASNLNHDTAPMLEDRDGMLAVKISGDSMTPWYPPGTIVYINSRDYPRPGKRVIAKLKSDGEVVFKVFYRKENQIMLLSIDDSGRDFTWETPNENPFSWIYPIKYSFRDEDALDSEMEIHGIEHRWKDKINKDAGKY